MPALTRRAFLKFSGLLAAMFVPHVRVSGTSGTSVSPDFSFPLAFQIEFAAPGVHRVYLPIVSK